MEAKRQLLSESTTLLTAASPSCISEMSPASGKPSNSGIFASTELKVLSSFELRILTSQIGSLDICTVMGSRGLTILVKWEIFIVGEYPSVSLGGYPVRNLM